MRRVPTGVRYVGVVSVALFALAACGGSGSDAKKPADELTTTADPGFADQSVAEILAAAKTDMSALKTVHLKGSLDSGGEQVALDLALATDAGCTGNVGLGGGQAKILVADGHVYLHGDEDFWAGAAGSQADALVEVIGDKWVDAGGEEDFLSFCDLGQFVSGMFEGSAATGSTKGDLKKIDGVEAVAITNSATEGLATGWVSTGKPHYVLRLEGGPEGQAGSIDFTDFDASVDVKAPDAEDVLDLSSLG